MRPSSRRGPIALLVLALAAPAAAATGWSDLDPALRAALAPWQGSWDGLPEPAQRQLAANARAWLAMSPEQQAAYRTRAASFAGLAPDARARLRGHYADWEALDAAQRAQVLAAEQAYLALPEEARAEARERFDALDGELRAGWRLGPEVGRWFGDLRPFFAFVPVDQREATLAMLRTLAPPVREDLARLSTRLSPAQRERLREQLVEADPEVRGELVRALAGS